MTAKFKGGPKLWDEIQKGAKKAKSMTACVGYVGRNPQKVLKWRKGDTLIADISEENVRRGICSAKGALKLHNAKVKVFHAPLLHAKVYLFDSSAVVCSANASEGSTGRTEAGMVVTGEEAVQARAWVASVLARPETVRLDEAILKALAKKEPKSGGASGGANGKGARNEEFGGRLWMLGVDPDHDETKAEKAAADASAGRLANAGAIEEPSDVSWVAGVGAKVFKTVKPGHGVVEAWWPHPHNPSGRLDAFRVCLAAVDLGKRFRDRRYRLALSDKAVSSRRMSPDGAAKPRVAVGVKSKSGWPMIRRVPEGALPVIRKLLGISKG